MKKEDICESSNYIWVSADGNIGGLVTGQDIIQYDLLSDSSSIELDCD